MEPVYPRAAGALIEHLNSADRLEDLLVLANKLVELSDFNTLSILLSTPEGKQQERFARLLCVRLDSFPWFSKLYDLIVFLSNKRHESALNTILTSLVSKNRRLDLTYFIYKLIDLKQEELICAIAARLTNEEETETLKDVLAMLANTDIEIFRVAVVRLLEQGKGISLVSLIDRLWEKNLNAIESMSIELARFGLKKELADCVKKLSTAHDAAAAIMDCLLEENDSKELDAIFSNLIETKRYETILCFLFRLTATQKCEKLGLMEAKVSEAANLDTLPSPASRLNSKEYLIAIIKQASLVASKSGITRKAWILSLRLWIAEEYLQKKDLALAFGEYEKAFGRFAPEISELLDRLTRDARKAFQKKTISSDQLEELASLARFYKGDFQNSHLTILLKMLEEQVIENLVVHGSVGQLERSLESLERYGKVAQPTIEAILDAVVLTASDRESKIRTNCKINRLRRLLRRHDWQGRRIGDLDRQMLDKI